MAELLKRASERARKGVKKFYPESVAEEGGVRVLTKGMFLRERLDKIILDPDKDRITALQERHNEITLPWLNVGKGIGDLCKRNDHMNDLLAYYAGLCDHMERVRLRDFNRVQDDIRADRLAGKIAGLKEAELPKLLKEATDLELIPVNHKLERHKARIERFLGWGGDTLMGISMDNPDDNKNIILRTPVIIDQSKIKKIRVGGGTPDEHDPTKIPE